MIWVCEEFEEALDLKFLVLLFNSNSLSPTEVLTSLIYTSSTCTHLSVSALIRHGFPRSQTLKSCSVVPVSLSKRVAKTSGIPPRLSSRLPLFSIHSLALWGTPACSGSESSISADTITHCFWICYADTLIDAILGTSETVLRFSNCVSGSSIARVVAIELSWRSSVSNPGSRRCGLPISVGRRLDLL